MVEKHDEGWIKKQLGKMGMGGKKGRETGRKQIQLEEKKRAGDLWVRANFLAWFTDVAW